MGVASGFSHARTSVGARDLAAATSFAGPLPQASRQLVFKGLAFADTVSQVLSRNLPWL